MYVFVDSNGWVVNIAVADREIPELTAMGGAYLDDVQFTDVYQNPRSYKIVDSQPVKQENERPPKPTPEPTELEVLQEDNASLWYESMIQSTRVEANETEVASLWYELMMGGM